jgi:tetratricopeptide (TPR) repeat protein
MVRHMNRETFEIPDAPVAEGMAIRNTYIEALKDWAKHGAASPYALSAEEVRRRMRGPSEAEVLAANHARLGRFLFKKGQLDAAKRHFREASQLHPDSWNYRRQSMMLDPESLGQLNAGPDFWAAVDKYSDRPYYPAPDFSRAS